MVHGCSHGTGMQSRHENAGMVQGCDHGISMRPRHKRACMVHGAVSGFSSVEYHQFQQIMMAQSQALLPVLYQLYDIGRKQRRAMAVSGYDVAANDFIRCVER